MKSGRVQFIQLTIDKYGSKYTGSQTNVQAKIGGTYKQIRTDGGLDTTGFNQLNVYALNTVSTTSWFYVPPKFLIKGFYCSSFNKINFTLVSYMKAKC